MSTVKLLLLAVLMCLFLQLVDSVYQPVRFDDIKKLVFRKYEKTEGNYPISISCESLIIRLSLDELDTIDPISNFPAQAPTD